MLKEEQAGSTDPAAPKGFSLKEILLGVALSSCIFFAMSFLPSAGAMAGLFTPVVLMYYYLKLGRVSGLLVLTVSLFIVEFAAAQAGLTANTVAMFLMGSSGLILGEFLKRDFAIEKTVFYAVLVLLGMSVMALGVYCLAAGEEPLALVQNYVNTAVRESVKSYAEWGISQEQVTLIRDNADVIARTVYHLLPAFTVMAAVLFMWINVLAGRMVLARRSIGFPEFGDLTLWKIPDQMVWYVIASAALILVPVDRVQIAGLNLLLIFLFIYLFQGLSIINFFFLRKNVSVLIRGVFYFLIFAQHFLLLLVICLGFFDIWIDFRKLNKIAKDPSESAVEG